MTHTDQELDDLFNKAPQEVQDALSSQETLDAIRGYMNTYQLHVDTMGKIAELTRNLLLGITSPTEFYEELVLVGVSPETSQKIVDDLNKKIFAPLREKMRGAGTTAPAMPDTVPAIVTRIPPPPAPQVAPPAVPVMNVASAPTAAVAPVVAPIATPVVPLPQTLSEPYTLTPAEPAMRTMAHDVEAIKEGVAPAPVSHPLSMPATPSMPPTAPESNPLPSQWSAPVAAPTDTPSFTKTSAPQTPRTSAPDLKEVTSTLQKYGIDPYREPPE